MATYSRKNATLDSATPITYGAIAGRDYLATVEGGSVHGRFYVLGRRLVALIAAGPEAELPYLDLFFASFTAAYAAP